MKNLPFLFLFLGALAIWQISQIDISEPPDDQEISFSNGVDSLRSLMNKSGVDTHQIDDLVKHLRPILLAPPSERTLELWYLNKNDWLVQYQTAKNIFLTAELILQQHLQANEHREAIKVQNALGRLYDLEGLFATAIKTFEDAYKLASKTNDHSGTGWNLTAMAGSFVKLGDYSAALEFGQQALDISREINHPGIESSVLLIIAGVKSYQGEYDSSMALMQESLEIARNSNFSEIELRGVVNISYNLNHLGRYQESIDFLQQHIQLSVLSTSLKNLFICYNMQDAYRGLKNYEQATYYLDLGCNMADELGVLETQFHCQNYRVALLEDQGLYEQALAAFRQKETTYKEYAGLEQTQEIQSLKTRQRLLEKDLEIERLDQQRLQRERTYQQRLNGIIYASIFLFMGIYLYMRGRQRVREEISQRKFAEAKLQVLQSQMHPHFIFNALGGIQNYVLKSEKIEAYNYLGKFATLLRSTTKSSNKLHVELEEEIKFLKAYLDMEKLRFRQDFVYTLDVDPSLLESRSIIPRMIIQPFVENALIHGFAGLDRQGELQIHIAPSEIKQGICCTVIDNGRGRNAAQKIVKAQPQFGHLSIATSNINKRLDFLRQLGYQEVMYQIEDLVGNGEAAGTKVKVFLPLIKEDAIV